MAAALGLLMRPLCRSLRTDAGAADTLPGRSQWACSVRRMWRYDHTLPILHASPLNEASNLNLTKHSSHDTRSPLTPPGLMDGSRAASEFLLAAR